MNNVIVSDKVIHSVTQEEVDKIVNLEEFLLTLPQVDIQTDHIIHGGMYARTIKICAGVVLTGAIIKIPTILVVNGDCSVLVGDKTETLSGFNVFAAMPNRKQVFVAHSDTYVTMIFKSNAKSVSEAEEEFTDEANMLFSRNPQSENTVTITGA